MPTLNILVADKTHYSIRQMEVESGWEKVLRNSHEMLHRRGILSGDVGYGAVQQPEAVEYAEKWAMCKQSWHSLLWVVFSD